MLLAIYFAAALVAFLRYDMSTEMANADLSRTLPVSLSILMTAYRIFLLVTLGAAMFLPLHFRVSRPDLARILRVCWIMSVILSVCGILDYFGVANLAFSYRRDAGYKHVSVMGFHRGPLGMISVYGLFLTVACYFIHRGGSVRKAVPLLLPLQFASLVLSWSRVALISLACASLALLCFPGVRHRGRLVVGLGIAAGLVMLGLGLDDEIYQRLFFFSTGYTDTSLDTRAQTWQSLVDVIWNDPSILLAGCGFGNFNYYYNSGMGAVSLEVAHNNYLHVLSECGVAGLAFFLTWLAVVLRWALRWQRRMTDPVVRAVHLCFTGILISAAASCLSQESLTPANATVPLVLHFFLLHGVWLAWSRTEMENPPAGGADFRAAPRPAGSHDARRTGNV